MKLSAVLAVVPVVGLLLPPVASHCRSAVQDQKAAQDATPKTADKDDEEDDEAAYREVLAKRAIQENCLICHEAGMYTNQRLTPAQWKAEIDKMVSWGAPLPPQDQQGVIDHLAKTYRDVDPAVPPGRVTLATINSLEIPRPGTAPGPDAGDPAAGAELYKTNCANCHGPTALGGDLGPSLAGRAVLNSRKAYDEAVHKGVRKMPAFDKVLNASQQHDVFAWLLQVKP
ncbi:c-type cytochrome [Paludisphaera borealis]|uniref:Cytochrome c6 n=1 Tax=Paludisphaera borealis TaxID=1387353 RepID=A0A1U7CIG1_9BACT|nr:c-type cytochrome [Paludisphaera borealis]APW58722.1 Cytochrome c6 [Paludisphaera borealis]